jgi:hypothetical protein
MTERRLRALAETFDGGAPAGLVRTGRRCVASGELLHLTMLDGKVRATRRAPCSR